MRIGGVIRAAALLAWSLSPLRAAAPLTLSADGLTVYDSVNGVTWLANFNLPATNRFGVPVCSGTNLDPPSIDKKTCVNPSGSMSYQAATAWVAAMNAANYLGHSNWQLPTTPLSDSGCGKIGPQANSFGFGCSASALGSLYYTALGLKPPNTAVPIPTNTMSPFSNLQPYLYWSQTISPAGNSAGYQTFSFASGYADSNTKDNFLYLLPMIPGKIPGTPATAGTELQVNPGGQTVYDPVTNVTWLANANLAASNPFGLPVCISPTSPALCVAQDGSMTWASAAQFIVNMNAGAGYLGRTNWAMPTMDQSCNVGDVCPEIANPLGELYYSQLAASQGAPLSSTPNIAVGAFNNIQPYLYWACGNATIQGACSIPPATGFEWSFSFGNGFEGTDILVNDLYVTAYFVGQAASTSGPEITEVANAEGESPAIAPNTWLEIKGVNHRLAIHASGKRRILWAPRCRPRSIM